MGIVVLLFAMNIVPVLIGNSATADTVPGLVYRDLIYGVVSLIGYILVLVSVFAISKGKDEESYKYLLFASIVYGYGN